jgi:hypothetical protein
LCIYRDNEWEEAGCGMVLIVCLEVCFIYYDAEAQHFLCACDLFNDAVDNSYYIASNNWMIVNYEPERMQKEAVVA